MLGELEERSGRLVVADLEQGVGTISRLQAQQLDRLVLVVEPYMKSIETARRAVKIATEIGIEVFIVANRAVDDDIDLIREVLGDVTVLTIPEDAAVRLADREGLAPIDRDPSSPAVAAIERIADRLTGELVAVPG